MICDSFKYSIRKRRLFLSINLVITHCEFEHRIKWEYLVELLGTMKDVERIVILCGKIELIVYLYQNEWARTIQLSHPFIKNRIHKYLFNEYIFLLLLG
jgi:hypothetical protein